jgi:hypothetical protein
VAILFIALFFTNFLFAQNKDTLVTKEIGVKLMGGSQTNLKGVFFCGSFYYSKKKIIYTLQYNYSGSNYINLDVVNFKGFLEQSSSVSALIGLNLHKDEWLSSINGGLSFGSGRFWYKGVSYNSGISFTDNTIYFDTDFFGLIFNCDVKHSLTDKMNAGIAFTSFFNYYYKYQTAYSYEIQHLNNYYGLQISLEYKIRTFKKS